MRLLFVTLFVSGCASWSPPSNPNAYQAGAIQMPMGTIQPMTLSRPRTVCRSTQQLGAIVTTCE